MDTNYHTPVLNEVVTRYLLTTPNGLYVDGTLGGGGHAESIAMNLFSGGKLIGLDVDSEAIAYAQKRLKKYGDKVLYIQENFGNIRSVLSMHGIGNIDGALLDLGISSHQLDADKRGFTFRRDEKIDMRMDQHQQLDAATVINTYDEENLTEIFWKYGEEKNSRRIAKRIVRERSLKSITNTAEFASIVEQMVGKQFLTKSLARIFQAIRIEVNNELENLRRGLRDLVESLRAGGRIVVLSYHSLEDRIVKDFFKSEAITRIPSGNKYLPDQSKEARLKILTKKPIMADDSEINSNPRARSAKLRVAERI